MHHFKMETQVWGVPGGGGGSVGYNIEECNLSLVPLISLLPVNREESSFTSIHASCRVLFLTMADEQWS